MRIEWNILMLILNNCEMRKFYKIRSLHKSTEWNSKRTIQFQSVQIAVRKSLNWLKWPSIPIIYVLVESLSDIKFYHVQIFNNCISHIPSELNIFEFLDKMCSYFDYINIFIFIKSALINASCILRLQNKQNFNVFANILAYQTAIINV